MKILSFTKMQGTGNDFVMLDNFKGVIPVYAYPNLALKLCNRHFGIGSDGIMILEKSETHSYKMRMFNPDGTESGACGNGTRCFAIYLKYKGWVKESFITIEGPVGPLEIVYLSEDIIKVSMGTSSLKTKDIGIEGFHQSTFINQPVEIHSQTFFATGVYTGNPHIVIFTENISNIPLEVYGPILEFHPLFTHQANVHFAEVISFKHVKMRTWEKGAGMTLACGSGACATVIAGFVNQLCGRQVQVDNPGGMLNITYQPNETVLMSGPAKVLFEGQWYLSNELS